MGRDDLILKIIYNVLQWCMAMCPQCLSTMLITPGGERVLTGSLRAPPLQHPAVLPPTQEYPLSQTGMLYTCAHVHVYMYK